jgi:uncharacterized membrane protein
MYPFHPLTIHLPIGLLLGNALLTMLYLRCGDATLETSAYHCLWLGWLGAALAVVTGIFDATWLVFDPANLRNDALGWINTHAVVGLVMLVVYWQAWQLRRRQPMILTDSTARRGYLARLALGVVLLVVNGWLGGYLVYSLQLNVRS